MLRNEQHDSWSHWPSCLSVLQEPTSVFAWSSWCSACWCPWCWQGSPQKEASFPSAVPNVQLPNAQQTRRRKQMKVRRTWCSHSLRFRHRFFLDELVTLYDMLRLLFQSQQKPKRTLVLFHWTPQRSTLGCSERWSASWKIWVRSSWSERDTRRSPKELTRYFSGCI